MALVVNLSGTIDVGELPTAASAAAVYELAPVVPELNRPNIIDSPAALESFETTIRRFLAEVEQVHGKPERIALFAAVSVSEAVTIGRVLMPHICGQAV